MSMKQERNATLPQAKPEGRGPWRGRVTIDRIVHSFAGATVLASLALTKWVHPNFIWLTVFVGVNLLQSGLTNWCLLSRILKRLGVPEGTSACGL